MFGLKVCNSKRTWFQTKEWFKREPSGSLFIFRLLNIIVSFKPFK
ncbi:hypothetical protein UGMREWDR_CDS0247 [Aeromonas phage GomatiRiver_11]|nr:hypothetical protein UGMREWDR_CDS0247 [Aeromonas phage GomatiRiver_11]